MVGKMSDIHVYHWSARLVHWLSALTVVCLFALGLWMVGLDYYSPWYQTAPNWHRSIGILLAIFTCLRLLLYVLPRPTAIASHSSGNTGIWEAWRVSRRCAFLPSVEFDCSRLVARCGCAKTSLYW